MGTVPEQFWGKPGFFVSWPGEEANEDTAPSAVDDAAVGRSRRIWAAECKRSTGGPIFNQVF